MIVLLLSVYVRQYSCICPIARIFGPRRRYTELQWRHLIQSVTRLLYVTVICFKEHVHPIEFGGAYSEVGCWIAA